jgi:hypothetical protein
MVEHIVIYDGDPAYPYSGRAAVRWDATSQTWQYMTEERVRWAISPPGGSWPSDARALKRVQDICPNARVTYQAARPVAPPEGV